VRPIAEETINEMLKKYLGISAPRIVIRDIDVTLRDNKWIWPDLVAILIAIYLRIIKRVLVLIDEALGSRALKSK